MLENRRNRVILRQDNYCLNSSALCKSSVPSMIQDLATRYLKKYLVFLCGVLPAPQLRSNIVSNVNFRESNQQLQIQNCYKNLPVNSHI